MAIHRHTRSRGSDFPSEYRIPLWHMFPLIKTTGRIIFNVWKTQAISIYVGSCLFIIISIFFRNFLRKTRARFGCFSCVVKKIMIKVYALDFFTAFLFLISPVWISDVVYLTHLNCRKKYFWYDLLFFFLLLIILMHLD